MPHRAVKDLDLAEVSILDKRKSPAYEGTLISARSEDDTMHFRGEDFIDEVEVKEDQPERTEGTKNVENASSEKEDAEVQEEASEDNEPKQQEIVDKEIDYSKYEEIIAEMKEEK